MAKPYTIAPMVWAKHLRKRGKRVFWRRERSAAADHIENEPIGAGTPRPRRRKPFVVEYRFIGVKRWPWQDDQWRPFARYGRLRDARESLRALAARRTADDEREFRLQPESSEALEQPLLRCARN
jgi:hypothetical protein